ncbi:MAG TPA: LON peptidase substrate-binding domain-containing protein [Mycobacteriales bacterium]|nr:LON peptidase substrate-binding domain-containing protein [Mycobacteriales bacterium]
MSSRPLPLFPLGTVLLPGSPLPLRVFEPRYRALVADLLEQPAGDRGFGVVAIHEGHEVGESGVRAMYDVGCLALVTDITPAPDGTITVLSVGTTRFKVTSVDHARPYLTATVEWLDEPVCESGPLSIAVGRRYAEYVAVLASLHGRAPETPELPPDARQLSYLVAAAVVATVPDRQGFLEEATTTARLEGLLGWLRRETMLLRRLSAVPSTGLLGAPLSLN